MIASSQLQGLSKEKAELFGKPHIGAHYTADDVTKYAHDFESCPICGNRVASVHHVASRGLRSFALKTPLGIHILKPALFALCGTGTTGCHGKFHDKKLQAAWVWKEQRFEDAWWNGQILAHIPPHSHELFEYGFWRISNKKTGEVINFLG